MARILAGIEEYALYTAEGAMYNGGLWFVFDSSGRTLAALDSLPAGRDTLVVSHPATRLRIAVDYDPEKVKVL